MSIQDAIKLDCQGLPVGASTRIYCPACSQHDMGVTRNADGILYNCHRASCGIKGFTGTTYHVESGARASPRNKLRPYEGALLPLELSDIGFFNQRFELHSNAIITRIERNQHDEYVLPVEWLGNCRGYNVRQPWSGAPRTGRSGEPKTNVWMHANLPVQAAYRYRPTSPGKTVVIVEDQLSAIKAAEASTDVTGVALLGTHMNIERVREIAMLKPTEVIIALDADATSLAFKHAREFGLAFQKCRVAILERDLKDTKMADISGVLGL